MDGDALHNGAESAILPFCIEKVKFAKLKEESAVGKSYDFWDDTSLNEKFDSESYIAKYYTMGTTNYPKIFNSPWDMEGLQILIDQYLAEKAYRTYQFKAE